jgi:predicted AlkP superfamily phosphohydrolase/phosphomutase
MNRPLKSPTFPTRVIALSALAAILLPATAQAYVGPGAGFAFVSSFLILFLTLISAFFVLLTWPIRWTWRTIKGLRATGKGRVRRVVIVGLDGQDPELTEKFMAEGLLPNFSRLREEGSFRRLRTSMLSESPVAWSSFQTGCNPGRHRIFDFLVPNRKALVPELSSAQVRSSGRTLSLGKYQIPLGKPSINLGRKSRPFWNILSDHGIFSAILRVPITFPPEKFRGVLLSAMCLPDLKGSQGTFTYYTSDPDDQPELTSGARLALEKNGAGVQGYISGPENSMRKDFMEMRIPFEARPSANGADWELVIDKKVHALRKGKSTSWIRLEFKAGLGVKVNGLAQFCLLETEPQLKLYMTPIHIDPNKPALPMSHPFTYAMYLAKTQGPFATLGVAEDTSALNEGVISEDVFLEQAWEIHQERERMFFDALEKTRRGLVCCVFDVTDRLQHMFFRYLDESHPANRGRDTVKHKDVIRDLYVRMDDLIGRVREKLDDNTTLMVMSDHGFKAFRRGVNLNTWLYENGFLAVKGEKPAGEDMLQDVDWSRTRAYAVGFGGIYLNLAGREAKGIVKPGEEAEALKREIRQKLAELHDEQEGVKCIREVYDTRERYGGPYVDDAPDLIAGFRVGHRVSWASVTGGLSDEVFEDNTRPWSGDHNMNPPDVPGMLFCNEKIDSENPHIMDLGPTVLDLFGVQIPAYCDGKSMMPAPSETESEPPSGVEA